MRFCVRRYVRQGKNHATISVVRSMDVKDLNAMRFGLSID